MEADPQFLSDYCDGEHFKHHPLFSQNPSSLQIILYYDELELCNPLGSRKRKHKIGNAIPVTDKYAFTPILYRCILLPTWKYVPSNSIETEFHSVAPSCEI